MRWMLLLLSFRLFSSEFDLKERVCNVLPTIDGWCSYEKARSFIDLVLEVKPNICVEIGVFAGSSVYPVASALKHLGNGFVIAIDPWDRLECIRFLDPVRQKTDWDWWGRLDLRQIETSFLSLLRTYNLEKQVVVLKMPSREAAKKVRLIDILYLDGNLAEEAVLEDLRLYLPKVIPGGYIWLNDALWESRQKAQDLLLESSDFIKAIDRGNCLLYQKRKR